MSTPVCLEEIPRLGSAEWRKLLSNEHARSYWWWVPVGHVLAPGLLGEGYHVSRVYERCIPRAGAQRTNCMLMIIRRRDRGVQG